MFFAISIFLPTKDDTSFSYRGAFGQNYETMGHGFTVHASSLLYIFEENLLTLMTSLIKHCPVMTVIFNSGHIAERWSLCVRRCVVQLKMALASYTACNPQHKSLDEKPHCFQGFPRLSIVGAIAYFK